MITPKKISHIALLAPVFAPTALFAEELTRISTTLGNPAPGAGTTLEDFIYLLIDILLWVAIPALALAIIYSGYILVTAGGNEDQIKKGKQWIIATLIGAAIVLSARVIAGIVFGTADALD